MDQEILDLVERAVKDGLQATDAELENFRSCGETGFALSSFTGDALHSINGPNESQFASSIMMSIAGGREETS